MASRLINILFWLGLTVWIGALMSAAIAAMNTFPVLKELSDLRLSGFESYEPPPGEAGNVHGVIAAGMVMQGVFANINAIQFVAAPLVLLTLIAQQLMCAGDRRRPTNLIRSLCIVVATTTFFWHGLVQSPRMNRELEAYRDAARAGDSNAARAHQTAFDDDHPLANALLSTDLFLLLIAAAASAALTARREPTEN